jgi:hypothetical protein
MLKSHRFRHAAKQRVARRIQILGLLRLLLRRTQIDGDFVRPQHVKRVARLQIDHVSIQARWANRRNLALERLSLGLQLVTLDCQASRISLQPIHRPDAKRPGKRVIAEVPQESDG